MSGKTKKIQITFDAEEYKQIEEQWTGYGYSSVSEALRVIARGAIRKDSLRKQVNELRKTQEAIDDMIEEQQAMAEKQGLLNELSQLNLKKRTKTPTQDTTPKRPKTPTQDTDTRKGHKKGSQDTVEAKKRKTQPQPQLMLINKGKEGNYPRRHDVIEKMLKNWLSKGAISQEKFDKAKGIRQYTDKATGNLRQVVWL